MPEELPKTQAALLRGIARGLHGGALVQVRRADGAVATTAAGVTLDGTAVDGDQLPPWFCAAKPLLIIALAQLVSAGELGWDDPVARVVPEFGRAGKERVTLRHVITHSVGFRSDPVELLGLDWDIAVKAVCRTPVDRDMTPGKDVSYLPFTCWYLMGEVLRRTTGRPLAEVVRKGVLEPLGLADTHIAMSEEEFRAHRHRLTPVGTHQVRGDPARHEFRLPVEDAATCCGSGPMAVRGTFADLTRLYAVLGFRTDDPPPGVSRPVWHELVSRPEQPVFDHRHRVSTVLGMGLVFEGRHLGESARVFGPRCSRETLGHRGLGSLSVFADRAAGLVVATFFDTTNQGLQNRVRLDEVTTCVYDDCSDHLRERRGTA